MRPRYRLAVGIRLLAAASLLLIALPGAASAAPPIESCASGRAITYTAPVPADLRTPGTKLVEWRSEFIDAATGEAVVEDGAFNEVTFDPSAPIYPNSVLIRITRSTTILADGSVIVVPAINPDQAARMYASVYWLNGDKFFSGSFVLSFRYQTGKKFHSWSGWTQTSMGPEQSLCVETTKAIWKKGFGWE